MPDHSESKTHTIKQLQNQLQEKEAIVIQLQQALQNTQSSYSTLAESAHSLENQNVALTQQINALQLELGYISTTKAAIRKLFKTALRKARVYDLIYKNYNVFVPVYNLLFRDQWQPATLASALQDTPSELASILDTQLDNQFSLEELAFPDIIENANANIDTETLLVEATVVARALDIQINDESDIAVLEHLAMLITKTQHALCVEPSQRILPLLQAISKAGGRVTCLGRSSLDIEIFFNYNLYAIPDTLENWLATSDTASFIGYDLLCLNSDISPNSLFLLKGRLTSQTRIITFPAVHNSKFDWVPGEKLPSGLNFYKAPAEGWVNLLENEIVSEHHIWPWNYPTARAQERLPSGHEFPKISIITVTLNQGEFLEETIRSVLMQGYPNLEYIVIDGGSTDNTPVILDRYRHELTYCVSEPDQGQANALNKGFSRATGDILAWLNSDDYYLPGTLLRVATALTIYQCDMVTGGCRLYHDYDPQLSTVHHDQMPIGQVVPLPLENLLDIDNCWLKGNFFHQPEVFWTRDIWERSGAYLKEDLFYSMDYELWLRMAHAGAKIIHIPDILVNFRVHEAQKTYGEALPYLPELREVSRQFNQHL
jgi:GT2 family glycosyltransferase